MGKTRQGNREIKRVYVSSHNASRLNIRMKDAITFKKKNTTQTA